MPTVFTLSGHEIGDATSDAQGFYTQGQNLFNAGQYDAAAVAFEQANALVPSADLYYDIGQAYWNAGEWAQSKDAYQNYLNASPNATDAATVQGYINQLDSMISAERMKVIYIVGAGAALVTVGVIATAIIMHKKNPEKTTRQRPVYAY